MPQTENKSNTLEVFIKRQDLLKTCSGHDLISIVVLHFINIEKPKLDATLVNVHIIKNQSGTDFITYDGKSIVCSAISKIEGPVW